MTEPACLSLDRRYGGHGPRLSAEHLDAVLVGLLGHRSVRSYLPDPLPAGTLEALIAAAQSAATSSNLQSWSVVAVTDPARKARLAALAGGQRHIAECPLFLVWIADLARLRAIGDAGGLPTTGLDHLEMFVIAAIDAAIAAQNAVVAAEALGLGTVYIGALRNRPEEVAAEVGLPPLAAALFGLCVGHPDPARPGRVKPRLPQTSVLHHERYDQAAALAPVAAYDRTMAAFNAEERTGIADWSGHSQRRVAGPTSLNGRDRLGAALAALGFQLR
jgi:nitroreductase